jgi:hypothetical protein
MIAIRKTRILAPLLATAVLVAAPTVTPASTAGDVPLLQVLNTAALFANTGAYHACSVVNVSTGNVNLTIELIGPSGAVISTTGTITIAGGQIEALSDSVGDGYARCRISTATPTLVRGSLEVFYATSTVIQTFATSEAR